MMVSSGSSPLTQFISLKPTYTSQMLSFSKVCSYLINQVTTTEFDHSNSVAKPYTGLATEFATI